MSKNKKININKSKSLKADEKEAVKAQDASRACDDGYVEDCSGDDECHPESWIGDGFGDCEDQEWGADLTCYDNDGGDCDTCEDDDHITCWDSNCAATEEDCPEEPFVQAPTGVCISGDDYLGYSAVTVSWDIETVCGDGTCNDDESNDTCPEDCLARGECPDGQVLDCDGTYECWQDSWIDDGFCDDESQEWGADLTCYDNDGGDCDSADIIVAKLAQGKEELPDSMQNIVHLDDAASKEEDVPRVHMATISLSCEACIEGGPWENLWKVPAMDFGYFTIFGMDAGSEVCGTITYCEGAACSETSDSVCAIAGDESSVECTEDDGCDTAGSGDVNGDGSVNVLDIVQIVNVINGGSFSDECAAEAADVNGDGSANVLDIVPIVNDILDGRLDDSDALF